MSLRNYSLDEAAEVLRCKPSFLEDNLRRFPHQKLGRSVVFDEAELLAIKDMYRVRPAQQASTTPPAPTSLAQIKPIGRRRTG